MDPQTGPPKSVSGPLFIGSLAAYTFFGVYFCQLLLYLSKARFDTALRKRTTFIVFIVTIIELLSLAFIAEAVWSIIISNAIPVTPPGTGILNGLVACIVQIVFAEHIRYQGRKLRFKIVAGVIIFLALSQFGLSIAIGVLFAKGGNSFDMVDSSSPIAISIGSLLSTTLVCDIVITVTRTIIFKRLGSSVYASTQHTRDILIRNGIENALVTTICAGLNLIFFYARPQDTVHVAFHYVIGRLYAITLLVTLNRTIKVREAMSAKDGVMSVIIPDPPHHLPNPTEDLYHPYSRSERDVTSSYPPSHPRSQQTAQSHSHSEAETAVDSRGTCVASPQQSKLKTTFNGGSIELQHIETRKTQRSEHGSSSLRDAMAGSLDEP